MNYRHQIIHGALGIPRAVSPLLRRHLRFAFHSEPAQSAERLARTPSKLRSNTLADQSKNDTNKLNSAVVDRTWLGVLAFSAIAVVVVLTIAVIANLAIGRIIHWDIVSVLGTIGFVFLTIGRKFKSI